MTVFGADLCFTADVFFIFYFNARFPKMRQPIGVKFCTVISTRPSFIMPVQNFGGGPAPPKNLGATNMQNSA